MSATPDVDPSRRRLIAWLWRLPVLAVLAGGSYGLYEAVRVHFLKRRPDPSPEFVSRPAAKVAPLSSFVADWDSVPFELPGNTGEQPLPAVAVRLPTAIPGGLEVASGVGATSAHLAAFSRICTHQHCIVSLNRDVDAINFGFNYQTDRPALTCPCHLSVFDPLRAGQAVSGPAVLPLPRVRLEVEDGELLATGVEKER